MWDTSFGEKAASNFKTLERHSLFFTEDLENKMDGQKDEVYQKKKVLDIKLLN